MKRDSDKVVNSIDGTTYVDIGTEGHKDDVSKAYDCSMLSVMK